MHEDNHQLKHRLKEQFFDVIEKQIKMKDLPEVNETYNRLLSEGRQKEEVLKMMACVLCAESFDILNQQKPFNKERYINRLKKLPQLS